MHVPIVHAPSAISPGLLTLQDAGTVFAAWPAQVAVKLLSALIVATTLPSAFRKVAIARETTPLTGSMVTVPLNR
jgi:hypothetical protein